MYFDPEDRKYLEYSAKLKRRAERLNIVSKRECKQMKEDRARWYRAEKYNGSYLKAQWSIANN